jgi:2'-5' RNA ligase
VARDRASRPEAKPLRLFVAFDVSEDTKAIVAEAIAPWREAYPKARWVPTENWHVTIKFMGRTWPRLVEWVNDTLRVTAATSAAFETRLIGLGSFPSPGRARVLWAGLDDGDGRMAGLAAAIDAALAREFEPEARAFRAHLTVARSEPPIRLPEDFAASPVTGPPFPVDRLVLFRSHLQRPAPRYEPLATFPLGG